jgi:recombination protein RecA
MARKKKEDKPGKMSIADARAMLNKMHGQQVAFDLTEENPSDVSEWIPTGSRWLNSITCRGKLAGVPVGRITEIAGLEGSGKSYMAAQVAASAQKMNIDVVYFDSESAIASSFIAQAGVNVSNLMYVQAESVEFVLETIEELLGTGNQWLFIWDSLAMTPCRADIEGDFNPQSSIAVKSRVLAKGLSKLMIPLANANATFLVLNQLKVNITSNIAEQMTDPLVTPGGKALLYAYSLRIWLTRRKAKAASIYDSRGYVVGTEVKATIKKSRFGTDRRICNFKILFAGEVGVKDEESWLDAIKSSDHLISAGAWYKLVHKDGSEEKFQASKWDEKLEDKKFKDRVLELMDEEVILKFDERTGNAEDYYKEEEEKEGDVPLSLVIEA